MHRVLERSRLALAHDAWANRQLIATLARSGPPPEAVRWMAHAVSVRHLWLDRLSSRVQTAPVWPEWTVAEIAREEERSERAWTAYLEALTAEDLERSISYTSSRGDPWFSRVDDVLTHVALHGEHHRGQVAAALRAAGIAPPPADFIHARRTRAL